MLEFFQHKILHIWLLGGWTMIPLAVLSLMIYGLAVSILRYFSRREYRRLREETWVQWVRDPARGEGEVGEIIRYTQDEVKSADEIHLRFAEINASKFPELDRRLSVLNTLVAAAPLVGLLGTVFGMLLTFRALAVGGGKITDMMAQGISAALFPPEVGLCVALPGLMLIYIIKRKRHEYEAFLARLESVTIRYFRKQLPLTPAPAPAPPPRAAASGRVDVVPQPA
jgi:biopolymer transport protein ExbB